MKKINKQQFDELRNKMTVTPGERNEDEKCLVCDNVGQIAVPYKNKDGIILHRLVPCPHCERGTSVQRQIDEARYRRSQLPPHYAKASLDDFFHLANTDQTLLLGKYGAIFAMSDMAANLRISSHTVAHKLAKISQEEWIQQILAAPDDVRPGIVLWGVPGVGKTYLAAAGTNAIHKRGKYVLYMRMGDILQSLTDTWKNDETTGEALSRYREVPVLFIDDMNINSRDNQLLPYQREYAATIIRYRTANRLPTIITTNWNPQQFDEMWGEWTADVVLEGYHWFEMRGKKIRNTNIQWGSL